VTAIWLPAVGNIEEDALSSGVFPKYDRPSPEQSRQRAALSESCLLSLDCETPLFREKDTAQVWGPSVSKLVIRPFHPPEGDHQIPSPQKGDTPNAPEQAGSFPRGQAVFPFLARAVSEDRVLPPSHGRPFFTGDRPFQHKPWRVFFSGRSASPTELLFLLALNTKASLFDEPVRTDVLLPCFGLIVVGLSSTRDYLIFPLFGGPLLFSVNNAWCPRVRCLLVPCEQFSPDRLAIIL